MPLVTREQEHAASPRRQVLRAAAASAASSAVLVLVLSFAAWLTRDAAPPPRPQPDPVRVADAGVSTPSEVDAGSEDAALADAGSFDAGAAAVDAGLAATVDVAEAPVDARAVGAAVHAVAGACLTEALQFDPAIGGAVALVLELGDGAPPRAQVKGTTSPFLVRCLLTRSEALPLPAPESAWTVEVRLTLDGLRGTVTLDASELKPR